jgi:protein TonB
VPGIRLARSPVRVAVRALCAHAVTFPLLGAPSEATLIERVEPEFPREAIQAGAEKGVVRARMTLDSSGEVTRVDILEAQPRRVFGRAVVKTLSPWRFNSGKDGRNVGIDIEFKR